LYKQYKALLFTLAYQLTGSVEEAEDVVQDVFLKAYDIHLERLKEPKAYLCKMVTNRCLNLQKSAQKRREVYFGPWLPEPIRTSEVDTMEMTVVHRDLLSYAMLVLLERLTPTERTVFVLREAFGFDYSEIAKLLDKREENCRKLMSRAKNKMGISEKEAFATEPVESKWVSRFLTSLEQGNIDHVLSLLTEDVMLVADGGGKATAFKHPVQMRDRVAQVLLNGFKDIEFYFREKIHFELVQLNGETGILFHAGGKVDAAIYLQPSNGKVARIYIVRNPDKLSRFK
jgi:RNA polymerase sigma-70 factor (ECF subfamily)